MPRPRSSDSAGHRITIRDVAKRAGVSIAAVSRTLNLPPEKTELSEATRTTILQAAKELGYRPSWSARALLKGKTGNIAMLYVGVGVAMPFVFTQFMPTLVSTLRTHRYRLLLIPVPEDEEHKPDGLDWRDVLDERQVDGCIVVHGMTHDLGTYLTDHRFPAVLMNMDGDIPVPCIVLDDVDGARQAANHLIALGHRRIAYIWHPGITARPSVDHRRAGFLAAMTDAGLAETANVIYASPQDFADVWLQDRSIATGIICYSHREGIEICHELWRRGVEIPRELSVMAFNNVYPVEVLNPPLTVMAPPFAEMARVTAEVLVQQIELSASPSDVPASTPMRTVLPLALVCRESTAAPPR